MSKVKGAAGVATDRKRIIGIRELNENLYDALERAKEDVVIVTRHGTPLVAIYSLDGMSLEDAIFYTDKRMGGKVKKAFAAKKKGRSLNDAMKARDIPFSL